MIVIADKAINLILTKDCDTHHLIEKDNFKVFLSGAAEFSEIADSLILYSGRAFYNGSDMTIKSIHSYSDIYTFAERLEQSIGYFIFIVIKDRKVTVWKSLYRGDDLFYAQENNCLIISTQIEHIIKAYNYSQINIDYCQRFIIGDHHFSAETVFKGINQVQSGTFLALEGNKAFTRVLSTAFNSKIDVIEELNKSLLLLSDSRTTGLFFSGGFDSSLLFFCLKDLGFNFSAYHYLPCEFEHDSELREVREICKKNNILLKEIDSKIVDEVDLYPTYLPNTPFDIKFVQEEFTDSNIAEEVNNRNITLFTGHGGDHIFLQNPHYNVGVDVLYSHGFFTFLKELKKLSILKGLDYYKLLYKNVCHLFSYAPSVHSIAWMPPIGLATDKHPLLHNINPRYAKYWHVKDILWAIHLTQQSSIEGKINLLSPFLLQNIFFYFYNIPVSKLYTENFDRYLIRELAFNKYQQDIFWKKRKRSSSMYIFNVLNKKQKYIKEILLNGSVARELNLNKEKLESSINYNCTVKLNDELAAILNLYSLQLYVNIHLA
jgi:asparagine synthetase B (glutamine-hydrolysing)